LVDIDTLDIHSPRMRRAGRELLSLALMDARNQSLRWIALFEESLAARRHEPPPSRAVDPPLWVLGHIGWFQERWIARNVRRRRGAQGDANAPPLASIWPEADLCFDPAQAPASLRWQLELPDLQSTKQYLADTMETTLDLLETAEDDDDGLYVYRLALFHEDGQGEHLAEIAQAMGLGGADAKSLLHETVASVPREPLLFPATRWPLGSTPGGFVVDNEKWAHDVDVPEFEIDAQPVSWAQYAEFVADGGYDEPGWWSHEGRAWLAAQERRVPRYVDQMRQGVLQQRFGRLARVSLAQPAMHVSWYEAEAWCRWAGRRLPSEVEWEAAAQSYSRGFVWGTAWEWTASTFRPYPGFAADLWTDRSQPFFGRCKVLRGASPATPRRARQARFRRFAPAGRDDMFCGFRSCSP
jgi:ergothioneine biosynthesis protein EgtB